jgi:hypothetical protein
MKTAEDVAEELAVYSRRDNVGAVVLKDAIAQALTAYAEERVKEALAEAQITLTKICDKARAEALEEAAKLADHMYYEPAYEIAKAIRARAAVEEALLQRWDESKQAIISHAIYEAYEDAAKIAESRGMAPELYGIAIAKQIRARAAEVGK